MHTLNGLQVFARNVVERRNSGRVDHTSSFQFFSCPIKVRFRTPSARAIARQCRLASASLAPLMTFDARFNCREKRKKRSREI